MAKRKRLSPANPHVFVTEPQGHSTQGRPPIADVASDAAQNAVLSDVMAQLHTARVEGRMVLSLPLDAIALDYIIRDRISVDDDEMAALQQSIAQRGQQTPIEVLEISPGAYGLISGWRRCQAIAHLAAQGAHSGQVLAFLRAPAEASETYLAMVEENEIRVNLSYYERARIAARAVEQGVFPNEKAALLSLFQSSSRAKRSKIRSFLPLVHTLDKELRFAHLIGERLGLRLSAALGADKDMPERLRAALRTAACPDAGAEQAVLEKFLIKSSSHSPVTRITTDCIEIGAGITAHWDATDYSLRLTGAGMNATMRKRIIDTLKEIAS